MGCRNATTLLLVFMLIVNCTLFCFMPVNTARTRYDNEFLSYSIYFPEPSFNEKSLHGKTYTTLNMPGCLSIGKREGEPVLPVKYVKLLIPPGRKVVDIDITGETIEIKRANNNLDEKPVLPYQTPTPIGKKILKNFEFNDDLYNSFSIYPSLIEEHTQISYCRGYTILSLALNPVQYIPGGGLLLYFPELTVDIEIEKVNYFNPYFRNNQDDEEWVMSLVDNPTIIDGYETVYDVDNPPVFSYDGGLCNSNDDFDYVIITTTDNGLDDWVISPSLPYNWTSLIDKHSLDDGLNCTLVTIQEINACTDYWNDSSLFNDTPAHIREFCCDAYQDWGTDYILIGGDDEWIPAREMDYLYEFDVDSDIYWNHLDNTFNDDEDIYWGEEGDTGFDLYAEMYIGRLTCDEPQDVSNWMKKSFYYADSTETDYLDNAAFYAGDTGWDCEGDDFIEYSAIQGTDYWLGPIPEVYGTYPSWLGFQYGFETWNNVNPAKQFNLSVKWTAENPNSGWQGGDESTAIAGLKNTINNDQCTLISGIAHASATRSLDVYNTNWESDYHNTKPFLVHDYGCHCGDMDAADDGVLHSMLFHDDTELAFACVYNTGYGWGNLYSTNSSSSLQQKLFWDYFFDTNNNSGGCQNWQLGKAMAYARDTMAPTIDWDPILGTWRAVIQGCLLFGDPAQKLKIGTDNDIILNNENPANESINVSVGNISLSVNITDPEGDSINITFRTNASGSWQDIGNNSYQQSGIHYQTYLVSDYSTKIWWSINVTDSSGGSGWKNETYHFTTRTKNIPAAPTSFSATTYNKSQINLAWIKDVKADKTYIEWNTVESWSIGAGENVCNITGTSYSHTGLNPDSIYYYQAWSWNETDSCYSSTCVSSNNTTVSNNIPYLNGENPENITINNQRRPICNITVNDADSDYLDVYFYENTTGFWVLQQNNNSIASGSNVIWDNYTNASNYNTAYWWSVNVTDGYNWTNETYCFTTENLEIVYVDDDYNNSTQDWLIDRFSSIQQGINNITNDGTVIVYNGSYKENLVVNKSIILQAADNSEPVLNGSGLIGINIDVNNTLIQNITITNCSTGIYVYNSLFTTHNVTISNNIINNNSQQGIFLKCSDNNTIESNTVDNNTLNGILLQTCLYNTIKKNKVYSNSENGTCLVTSSENNVIYHNNIFNNTKNNSYDESTSNIWHNDTLGGNYWGDYNGTDNDENGIGDTSYNIAGGDNNDTCPLMRLFEYYYILSIDVSSSVNENNEFTVTVETQGGTTIQGATVIFNGETNITDSNGQFIFTAPSVSSDTDYIIYASKSGYTGDSVDITVENVQPTSGGTITNTVVSNDYIPPLKIKDSKPVINNLYHEPTTVTSNDIVTIYVDITDDNMIDSAILFWDDGEEHSKSLSLYENNIYTVNIGPFIENIVVYYWVNATDNSSQSTESSKNSFTVTDTSGPSINTITPLSGSIIYDTTPSIKISYSDPSGINADSIILTIDGITVEPQTLTSTELSYTSNSEMSYTSHTIVFSLSDLIGNSETKEWTFDIRECESVSEQNVEEIISGEEKEIIIQDIEDISIENIKIISSSDLTDVKLTIVKLKEKPDEITTEPLNKILFEYLDIKLTTEDILLNDEHIDSLKISFKVKKQWINDNNINKENVTLLRFHENKWETLNSNYISEDSTYVYYEAITTGTSVFAIAGEELVGISNMDNDDSITWFIIIGAIILGMLSLLFLLFKLGFLYFEPKNSHIRRNNR